MNKSNNPLKAGLACFGGLALLLGISQLLTGCGTVAPGADAVEVRAEQSIGIAGDTLDTFLHMEYDNIDLVRSNAPAVHQFAEWLRQPTQWRATNTVPRDIALVNSANDVRLAYKANRSADNKASLASAMAALDEAIRQAQGYLVQLGNAGVPAAKPQFSEPPK